MAESGLLAGKRGLIMGVANERSIAWGIAQSAAAHGAELAFTYQGDAFRKRVLPLVEPLRPAAVIDCDVSFPASIDAAFAELAQQWDRLDFLVHAIAFSDREQLRGRYVDTTPENFAMTMNISCYSFTAVARRAEKLMTNGGSLLTLTYYGAEKVTPHYNVMGVAKAALEASVRYMAEDLGKKNIRVNALSAGPIRTLAAAGVGDFRYILKWNEFNSPLRRTVTHAGSGRLRHVSRFRSLPVHYRRGDACGLRIPCRRNEGGRRARHFQKRSRTGNSSAARAHVLQQFRPSVSRHDIRRESRPGDWLRGRRMPAWNSAHRSRYPALAGPAKTRSVEICQPAQRTGFGADSLRRLSGRKNGRAGDDGHADRSPDREYGCAVEGLWRYPRQIPSWSRRLYLLGKIWRARLSRRRSPIGAGDRNAGRGRRDCTKDPEPALRRGCRSARLSSRWARTGSIAAAGIGIR